MFRRWSPPIALALSWAAAVVQMLQRQGPLLVDVAIFAVLFACAAYGGRGVRWAAFVSAVGGRGDRGPLRRPGAPARRQRLSTCSPASWSAGSRWCPSCCPRPPVSSSGSGGSRRRTGARRRRHPAGIGRAGAHPHRAGHARRRRSFARGRDRAGRRRPLLRGTRSGGGRRGARHHRATARAALADVRVLLQQLRSRGARTARSRRSATSTALLDAVPRPRGSTCGATTTASPRRCPSRAADRGLPRSCRSRSRTPSATAATRRRSGWPAATAAASRSRIEQPVPSGHGAPVAPATA